MWHIYTMEYYSATKMNEVMMHATTQIKLKNIARNKRTQIQKVIYYIPILILNVQTRQIHKDRLGKSIRFLENEGRGNCE